MHDHHAAGSNVSIFDVLIFALILGSAIFMIAGYVRASSVGRGRRLSLLRTICWVAGIIAAVVAVTGPLARAAHHSFTAHMITHLLLGMLAPLLLVLARPVTVLLRALSAASARRLTRVLRSVPIRIVTEPIVAALLNVGGLWLLYTTDLYAAMHTNLVLHAVVHLHMFLAGYAFTVAIIDVDPMPHRRSHRHRALILIIALAAHDILAKYLYTRPPPGVSPASAETGAMIMYYGGDTIDLALITLLCAHWYRITRPRPALAP